MRHVLAIIQIADGLSEHILDVPCERYVGGADEWRVPSLDDGYPESKGRQRGSKRSRADLTVPWLETAVPEGDFTAACCDRCRPSTHSDVRESRTSTWNDMGAYDHAKTPLARSLAQFGK